MEAKEILEKFRVGMPADMALAAANAAGLKGRYVAWVFDDFTLYLNRPRSPGPYRISKVEIREQNDESS